MSSYVERLLTELNANLCWPFTSVELLALGYKWVNVTLCQLLLSSEACTLQLSWTVESEPAKPEVSGINSRRKPYVTPHPFLKQALLKRRHMFDHRHKFVAAPTSTLFGRHMFNHIVAFCRSCLVSVEGIYSMPSSWVVSQQPREDLAVTDHLCLLGGHTATEQWWNINFLMTVKVHRVIFMSRTWRGWQTVKLFSADLLFLLCILHFLCGWWVNVTLCQLYRETPHSFNSLNQYSLKWQDK